MVLFIWGRWRYDVVALLALMCSVLLGAVPFKQVYIGLANPAVITVACVMVISQAITQSGLLDRLVRNFTEYTRLPKLMY
ncbi:MAG: citrate transporter, partial [Gammaproteobacteria bacterium]|nr:citrate transporter [Gammaproteobacteria bacterium]